MIIPFDSIADNENEARCVACGVRRHKRDMRPYGRDEHHTVVSWVCKECRDDRVIAGARPHLQWATVARAERLATTGLGWSADHVMRKALDLLEQATARMEGVK